MKIIFIDVKREKGEIKEKLKYFSSKKKEIIPKKKQEAKSKKQKAKSKKQEARSKKQKARSKKQEAKSKKMDTCEETKIFLNELNKRLQTKITMQKEKAAKEKMEELQTYSIAHGLPIPFWVAGHMSTFEEIEKDIEGAKSAVACAEFGLKDDIFAQNLDFIRVPW